MSPCYTPNCSNTRKSNKYELNATEITWEINNTAAHATYVPHSCFASVPALAQSSFKGWTMEEQHLAESREPPLSFTIQGKEKTIGPKAFSVKNNKFWILNCCLYTNKTKSSYNSCCFTPAEHLFDSMLLLRGFALFYKQECIFQIHTKWPIFFWKDFKKNKYSSSICKQSRNFFDDGSAAYLSLALTTHNLPYPSQTSTKLCYAVTELMCSWSYSMPLSSSKAWNTYQGFQIITTSKYNGRSLLGCKDSNPKASWTSVIAMMV